MFSALGGCRPKSQIATEYLIISAESQRVNCALQNAFDMSRLKKIAYMKWTCCWACVGCRHMTPYLWIQNQESGRDLNMHLHMTCWYCWYSASKSLCGFRWCKQPMCVDGLKWRLQSVMPRRCTCQTFALSWGQPSGSTWMTNLPC